MRPEPRASTLLAVGRVLAEHGRVGEIVISGQSMGPLFAEPRRARVAYGAQGLRPGDVVLYASGNTIVAHRLLAIRRNRRGRFYLAKGDANLGLDPLFPERAVIGRLLEVMLPTGPVRLRRRRGYAYWCLAGAWVQRHLPWRAIKAGRWLRAALRRLVHVGAKPGA
jgi:hypothetical protein